MLETAALSAVRSRSRRAVLPVSIVLHALAGGTALFASIWAVDFPAAPPDQFSIIRLEMRPAIPEPLGNPEPPAQKPPSDAAPVPPSQITAPIEIPDEIPDLPGERDDVADEGPSQVAGDQGSGGPVGVPWGVDGGVDTGSGDQGTGGTDQGAPLPVGGDVKAPTVIHRVEPRYPAAMVKMRREGIVIVECIIDRRGAIREARPLRSPHPLLEAAAVEAVRQWRFAPGTLNGNPVDVVFVLTVRFELD